MLTPAIEDVAAQPLSPEPRPRASAKFFVVGAQKLYVRGVIYKAPSAPNGRGSVEAHLKRDFEQLEAAGVNAVYVAACPAPALLGIAQEYGLRVLVGLTTEDCSSRVIDGDCSVSEIEEIVRKRVKAVAGHPALLGYSLAHEFAETTVSTFGPRRAERYLKRLYNAVKAEDPVGLVTCVHGPATTDLQLSFFDFACYSARTEDPNRLRDTLAQLHQSIGDVPLLVCHTPGTTLDDGSAGATPHLLSHLRTIFDGGCAGAFVSLPDRSGSAVSSHPDLEGRTLETHAVVRAAFEAVPFPRALPFPRVSVVVCSHNGGRTIGACLEALRRLEYPDFEVLVVDDGSTDETGQIALAAGFPILSTRNRGLGSARNTGLAAASGEIVAFVDDDAFPDPHWLMYLAGTFLSTNHAGVGGPNVPPPGESRTAQCVAHAPGGPIHVMLSEHEAEHIPGCNMAFRVSALKAVGGFNPGYRVAGDDVDLCWRIRERGWTVGFNPGAVVWHRRRGSVRAYWKQQRAYGRAEALLEKQWGERFNTAGHVTWAGGLYANGFNNRRFDRAAGVYGRGSTTQAMYGRALGLFGLLALMPEWYLLIAGLGTLSLLGLTWPPLLLAVPLFGVALAAPVAFASLAAASVQGAQPSGANASDIGRGLIGLLHLLQPLARLTGRLGAGLWPGRWRGPAAFSGLWPFAFAARSDHQLPREERVRVLEATLRFLHARVVRGGPRDRWALEVRGGVFGAARVLIALDDQQAGIHLVRVRAWPCCRARAYPLFAILGGMALWAGSNAAWLAGGAMAGIAVWTALTAARDCCHAMSVILGALETAHDEGA